MSATTTRGYPYPQLADTVDVPGDMQDLATAIDTDVATIAGNQVAVGCRLTQGTAQTGWTSGAYNTLLFGTEDFDTNSLHDIVSSTSRIVIGTKLGMWMVGGTLSLATATTLTNARVRLTANGSAVNGNLVTEVNPDNSDVLMLGISQLFVATLSTDYVEMQGLVTGTGAGLGTSVNTEARSSFWATWIGS